MKKVLIITYYWPPSGGIGVLRCLKFAKYLREFGWEPVIFTAENAHYPSLDYGNEKDIPQDVTILRQKIWEPYSLYKWITGQKKDANVNNVFYASEKKQGFLHKASVFIRSNFFIPDARAQWIQPSVNYLVQYLKENPVDAILSNGPPHSNTRIANLVKKATGIPWLADFQDPWSQVDYFAMLHLTSWGLKKHLRMEQEVFRDADAITIVSDSWKKDLEKIGARNVSVLPWGYDADDFKKLSKKSSAKFTITHIGILGSDRNPEDLINACTQLDQELQDFKKDLCLQLVGLVDRGILSKLQEAGFEKQVELTGNIPRQEALQLTLNCRVQLLMLNKQENAEGRIPGKLFEYLGAGNPILCFGPLKSDVADILLKTQQGYYCPFEDTETAISTLRILYHQYKSGTLPQYNEKFILPFANRCITGRLAKILDEISS